MRDGTPSARKNRDTQGEWTLDGWHSKECELNDADSRDIEHWYDDKAGRRKRCH